VESVFNDILDIADEEEVVEEVEEVEAVGEGNLTAADEEELVVYKEL